MKKRHLYLVTLLLFAMMTSCVRDWTGTTLDDEQDGSSQIVLRIKTPSGFSSGAATRSLTMEEERKIEDIWVLAFNAQGDLTEMRKGENLTDIDATTRSFTATLQRSKNAADTYNLMVLANAEEIIKNQIGIDIEKIQDKSYTTIITLLNKTIGGKMYASGGTIPMWGETGALEIKLGLNNNISLSLLRSVARIDIGVGSPMQDANGTYKWTGKDSKDKQIPFELKEVYVVKANDRYAVVPNAANITDQKATAPTVPTDAIQMTMEQSIANFKYADAELKPSAGEFGSYTTQSIYVPEANLKLGENAKSGDANHENRMAIIVGGDYNSSGRTTYYRLDLAKNGEILDALRNHLYQFNISKVSGFGYADVETAYRSLSMNMQVDILDWDESEMGDVIFDGQNYFSISKSKVEFSPMGKESETVTIKTNVKSLELWEEREGGEHLEMKLGGTTTYENADMGYKYTLTTVTNGSAYTLKIEATKHNVSNTVPNRLDKWKIKANRLNATFEVDQQYTVLYVSYVNGQSQNLYPEGTLSNTISIDIMALKPVEIKAEENGTTATWIDLGDYSGLITGDDGLYQARLQIKVDPFVYAQNISTIRTGTITVTPQDEAPRVFTINQESPIFKFAKATETVTRKTGSIYHTYVDIITNLQETDFTITEGTSTGVEAWRITHKENLYNVDKTNPRSLRFDVDVDMQKNTPMGTAPFDKSFTATVDTKYGQITLPFIKFDVLKGDSHFDWFWKNAIVPPLTAPYNFLDEDNSMLYIFPWQTTSATIHFNSNNGLEYDTSNTSNKPRKGTLTKGTETSAGDYNITPYTFTFNKEIYNTADYYDLYFKSTTSTVPLVKNVKMGLGVQMWKRNPTVTSVNINYKGYPETTPYTLNVTSNVDWEATITSANFIKMRPTATAAWVTPPMQIDDRVLAPEAITSYNAEINLVKTNTMGIAITPHNILNAVPREVNVQFVNKSFDAGGSKGGVSISNPTLKLTQYAPILKYETGAPTSVIPYYGDSYTIRVSTNLQSWGVRVYQGNDNTGTKLVEKAFGTSTSISDKAPTERTLTINISRYNASADRNISFYLYHTATDVATKEIKVITQTQSWVDYIVINGMKWKRGNLIASNGNNCTIGSPTDAGLYFKYGSLLGWSGGSSNNGTGSGSPTSATVYTKPSNYTGWTSWSNVNHHNSGGFPSNNGSIGMGDPCSYYLGGYWRTPTKSEYATLRYSNWLSYSSVIGVFGGTSGWNIDNAIFFPASGKYDEFGNIPNYQAEGAYLSSDSYNQNNNYALWFSGSQPAVIDHYWRARAYTVRCVNPY